MRAVAIVWAVAGMAFGCAAPNAAAPDPAVAGLETPHAALSARGGLATNRVGGGAQSLPGDAPDRDPAARGPLAVDMSAADLPDDRDGDGVDQLDLCPELPPDRVDGCPHAR